MTIHDNEIDSALKVAMKKRNSHCEISQLSSGFSDRVMSRIDNIEERKVHKSIIKFVAWKWAAVAALIVLICYLSVSLFSSDNVDTEPVKVIANKESVRPSSFDASKLEVMPATLGSQHKVETSHEEDRNDSVTIQVQSSVIEPEFEWAISLLAGYDEKNEGRLRTVEAPKIRHDSQIEKPITAERTPQEIERELYQNFEQITRQGKELVSIINEINENEQKQFTIYNFRQ